MPDFDRWVQRYVRRISVGEFLRDAAEWLAGFCFVFGSIVLLVKLRLPNFWPQVLWLVVAAVPITTFAWWMSRRRRFSQQDAVAMLDQKLDAGGLLMTISETADAHWAVKLPMLERLWQNALPKLRPVRFAKLLILPTVFAVASCFVPLRNLEEPVVKGAVAQQAMHRLEEFMQQLEEAEVIQREEPESEQLRDEMKKLADETKDRPLTHEKWETVDALQERLKAKLDRSADVMSHASEAIATLSEALSDLAKTGEMKLSEEQFQQLEKEVQQAMQQLAKSGSFGKLPAALRQKLGAMAKGGQFKLPDDAAEREALLAELQEHLALESKKLAELCQLCRACENGAECDKDGKCFALSDIRCKQGGRPGKGGVTEGRGDAELEFGDASNSQGAKFKESVLPPGFLDKPRDEVLAITAAAPEVKPAESAPRNAARGSEATSGNETWNRSVRPRHRSVVKSYFSEKTKP